MPFWWSCLQIMALARSFPDILKHLIFIASAVILTAGPGADKAVAQAGNGWSVCNETSRIIETSTGRPSGSDVIVEGWTRIRPGECRVVMPAPLKPGPHFLYGRSSRAHRGGVAEWTGEYTFCVDGQGSFSVESPPDCLAMGLEPRKFQPVLVESRTRWSTTLRETEKYDLIRAKAAGIQRLLDDAGVESGKIDGYIGRRTRQSIAAFLKSKDLPENPSDDQLIDYLEQVAIDRARNLGLTICNRTKERTWTAIARRRGEGWESRGWWPIDAGGCARVIDTALLATPHYIFAEIETDTGLKRLSGTGESFCISRSHFAILGRDKCKERFYQSAPFIESATPEDGRLVYELFDRDFREVEGKTAAGERTP